MGKFGSHDVIRQTVPVLPAIAAGMADSRFFQFLQKNGYHAAPINNRWALLNLIYTKTLGSQLYTYIAALCLEEAIKLKRQILLYFIHLLLNTK